jgi:hypothetical protein
MPLKVVRDVAADGLWVQSAAVAERTMNSTTHRQTKTHISSLGWRPAIDYVQLTRRKPYGTSAAVSVGLGCWRGEGAARAFETLLTVTLPANENRVRVPLDKLFPVFDNLSIGYTNADLVTVRLGNWKAISDSTDSYGQPTRAGVSTADGTPCGVVNDLEALCRALGAA